MQGRITSVAAILAAAMAGACAPPAVTPLNEAARKTVTAVSPEVNGIKHFNTQNLGARGSSEGASKGASQAAGAVLQGGGGNLLGVLILTPIAAAGGAAAGAAAAKPEAEVDQIRSNLSVAIQQTDFNTMLREELRRTPGTHGRVQIIDAALTAAPVPTKPPAAAPAAAMAAGGQPPPHMLSLDYNLGMAVTGAVVPDVQASVLIKGQILAPDRKTILHTNTWL